MTEPEQRIEVARLRQCASVEKSILSVAVAVSLFQERHTDRLEAAMGRAPHAAHADLRWLLTDGDLTQCELIAVLRSGLLAWSGERRQLVYGMTWRRHAAAALVAATVVAACAGGALLVQHGVHSSEWQLKLTACGAVAVGALALLQRYYFAPRTIALRALKQLRPVVAGREISKGNG